MKGVIAAIAPEVLVADASHDIEPGNVAAAAWVLDGYWRFYPAGTVHIVVVDPGVGSERRALACAAGGHFFVGPDNGVFTRVLRHETTAAVVSLDSPAHRLPSVSSTFHGRDVFAPAAAHLSAGVAVAELGATVADPVLVREREPSRDPRGSRGAVMHADRFGNLITNVPAEWVAPSSHVRLGSIATRVVRSYSEAEPGELLALIGSRGVLEVAVRNGSAADRIWSWRDLEVCVVSPREEAPPAE
jgi:S-adenosyl-L-methionine hydrolase (adenosine-forming)